MFLQWLTHLKSNQEAINIEQQRSDQNLESVNVTNLGSNEVLGQLQGQSLNMSNANRVWISLKDEQAKEFDLDQHITVTILQIFQLPLLFKIGHLHQRPLRYILLHSILNTIIFLHSTKLFSWPSLCMMSHKVFLKLLNMHIWHEALQNMIKPLETNDTWELQHLSPRNVPLI